MVITMDIERLTKLGLTKNEAKVYLSLVKFGNSDANGIIKDTQLHRKLVYENLEKLIGRGLVAFIIEGNKRIFRINSAHMLVELFEDKISEYTNKKKEAEKVVIEINRIAKTIKRRQEALIYRGKKGIRTFYKELLDTRKDYIVFGAPERSLKIMNEIFWTNFNAKRKDKKIKARLLFNESLREYGESIKDKLTEIKYFSKDFEPLTETNIQEDKVAIIVWTEEPILFLIRDSYVAASYKNYFEKMWKLAKRKLETILNRN